MDRRASTVGARVKGPTASRAEYQLLLRRPPELRSDNDVQAILELVQMQDATFILSLSSSVQTEVCRRLGLENFGTGERIFDYGDEGDKFYIILEGRVSIEVPRRNDNDPTQRPPNWR